MSTPPRGIASRAFFCRRSRGRSRRWLPRSVLVAADGNEALRVAASHVGAIDLLITDVVMPNLGGRALVDRIREVRPAIKVLYLSGYLGDAIMRHGVAEQTVNFLPKPFSPSDLAAKVRDALSS